jgi:hypothetical protein
MKNINKKTNTEEAIKSSSKNLSTSKKTSLAAEKAFLKKINKAKEGKLIKVRMWTNECSSSFVTHSKSITEAVKIIRRHSKNSANWSLEFVSEKDCE